MVSIKLIGGQTLLHWIDAVEQEIDRAKVRHDVFKVTAKLNLAAADKHARNVRFLDKVCSVVPIASIAVNSLRLRECGRSITFIRRSVLVCDLNPTYLIASRAVRAGPD